jgi:hypothetical protein
MSVLLVEDDAADIDLGVQPKPAGHSHESGRWIVFRYAPVTLFSLKMSRATSTAGKTLLTPTPYAVKMAFLDAALRHGLAGDADELVRRLAKASVRIGVPGHACVTGTIQMVRQETREIERKKNPRLPWYRPNIAMREFVHYQGDLCLAFDRHTCHSELTVLLRQIAPAVNYLGKRGSFFQYVGCLERQDLDSAFTQPVEKDGGDLTIRGQRATLDDFGAAASFDALNSFSATEIKWEIHRRFVETFVPFSVHNTGPGFTHYCGPGVML